MTKIYPADYTLTEWLELRKGWWYNGRERRLEIEEWQRAQNSALGPNLKARFTMKGSHVYNSQKKEWEEFLGGAL